MNPSPAVLLPYSIESFLSEDEVRQVVRSIDAFKAANPDRLQAGANGITIHDNPSLAIHKNTGLTVPEIVSIFEPAGRIEINHQYIPRDVVNIAERAFFRHIEDIRRAYPGSYCPHAFTYVEYGVGQHFTPHIDGIAGGVVDGQIAGFGVALTDDFEGGEFVIQTCGSNRLWVLDPEGSLVLRPAHDSSSEWFRSLPKTEWATRPKRGDAIFYGSALTHGSKPVTKGRLRKLLGFIH
jgi:hypothetical protein